MGSGHPDFTCHSLPFLIDFSSLPVINMTGSRLSNLTCVVTGAASGIGRSIALRYAEEGAAFVVCADLMEKPSDSMNDSATELTTDSTAARLSPGGAMAEEARNLSVSLSGSEDHVTTHELICQRYGTGKATYVRCDVSLEEADQGRGLYPVKDVIQIAVQTTGRLDV